MTFPAIHILVPHAKPMLLLDRVIAADAESLQTEVTIKADSLFFKDNGVAAWIGIEYMAQTIAAYAGYHALLRGEKVKVGFLLGTRHYECKRAFFAKDSVLQIHARCILQADNGLGSFECTINEAAICIANAIVTVFQPGDLAEFLVTAKQSAG